MRRAARSSEFSKIERARLYPTLTNPNFPVLRSRRLIFERWVNTLSGTELCILDVGGRYQPYRSLFGSRVKSYIACDILTTELVNVVASGESLPFADSTFDFVISTQVFEYFANPTEAAAQVHRVLKPGGALLMSVAAFAPRFVDEERWRFTPGGIRTILSQFSTVQIVPETSSIGGLLRASNLWLHWLARYSWARKIHEFTICPCLNLFAWTAESARITSNDQFAANYSVMARK